jgi:transglutaminase/protease-like cytokinesis protein 3
MNPYQLAMTYKLTHSGVSSYPFDFVQKFHTAQEFYIQEPQCYNLFPLQTYTFRLFSLGGRNQKLALRSPGGRMYKLLYYPQDISYDGTVTVSEVGMWNLVSLQQSTGGWHSIASWECTA